MAGSASRLQFNKRADNCRLDQMDKRFNDISVHRVTIDRLFVFSLFDTNERKFFAKNDVNQLEQNTQQDFEQQRTPKLNATTFGGHSIFKYQFSNPLGITFPRPRLWIVSIRRECTCVITYFRNSCFRRTRVALGSASSTPPAHPARRACRIHHLVTSTYCCVPMSPTPRSWCRMCNRRLWLATRRRWGVSSLQTLHTHAQYTHSINQHQMNRNHVNDKTQSENIVIVLEINIQCQ